MEKVNAVSDFIATLPLTRRENDELEEFSSKHPEIMQEIEGAKKHA